MSIPARHDAFADLVEIFRGRGSKFVAKGKGWLVQCPAHKDGTPSLSIDPGDGMVFVRCFAGCTFENILAALDLPLSFAYDNPKEGVVYPYPGGRIVHRNVDHKKNVVKGFWQGGNLKDRSLYLPPGVDLTAALAAKSTIYVAEGEKDANTLVKEAGVIATTNAGGAANWHLADWSVIFGESPIIIVADNDKAGIERARELRDHFISHVPRVDVVTAKEGKDATEHLLSGHRVNELIPLIFPTSSESEQPKRQLIYRTSSEKTTATHWAWRGLVPMGVITMAIGRGGVGKSTFLLWVAAQMQQGLLPGVLYGKKTKVLIFAHEDDWSSITLPRLIGNGAVMQDENGEPNFIQVSIPLEENESGERLPKLPLDIEKIEQAIEHWGASIVIIDPLLSMVADELNSDRAKDVRMAMTPLTELAKRKQIAVLGIAHVNKSGGAHSGDRMSGSHAWRDIARSTLVCALDIELGETFVSNEKNNYAEGSGTANYHYRLMNRDVPIDEANDDGEFLAHVGRVEWLGETTRSVDEVFADEITTARSGSLRNDVISYIKTATAPVTSDEIFDALTDDYPDATKTNIRQVLTRAVKSGQITRIERGLYAIPGATTDHKPDTTLGPLCSDCATTLSFEDVKKGYTVHASCFNKMTGQIG